MTVIISGTSGITAPGTETFGDGTALGGATNPIVSMAKGANNYVQGYIVNNTDAANSSADLVCYPSNGTDSSGWIDMGITGPTFSQAAYGITGQNEGYIFMSAPSGASKTGNLVLATDSTGTQNAIKFATGGFGSTTERMRLDQSGNLGLGVTPSAWWSSVKAIEVAAAGSALVSSGAGNIRLFSNLYLNNTPNYTYASTAAAAQLFIDAGRFIFYNAPSGTAGTTATLTQAMTLDASGNLLVGQTSTTATLGTSVQVANNGAKGQYAAGSGSASQTFTFGRDNVTTGNFVFTYNGSTISSISASTGSYTPLSDIRVKKNITSLQYGLSEILQLNPVTYNMVAEKDSDKKHIGLIAQEVKSVMDETVDDLIDAENQMYGLDKSMLVPVLVKAIQEQQAIIETLTTRITALEKA